MRPCSAGPISIFPREHIPGVDNLIADMISRPDESLSPAAWRQQIYHRDKRTRSWSYFQPSPELVSVLFSRLSTEVWLDHPKTPKDLGTIRSHRLQCTSVTSLGSWSPSQTVTRGEPILHKLLVRRVSQASWPRSSDENSSSIGTSPSRSTCTCGCLTTSMHPTVATVQTLGTGLSLTGSARVPTGATASKNGPQTSALETSTIRSSISLEIREPSCWAISLFVRKTKLDSTRTPSGVPASGQCGRSHCHTTDPAERFQRRKAQPRP